MVSVPFDPSLDLIYVDAELGGPRGARTFRFALDTGCSQTLITPEVVEEIGYTAGAGERITTVTSALGKEYGYQMRVARFETLGHAFDGWRVNVHVLHDDCGIQSLVGLDFLRRFNYEVRSAEGRILVSPVAATN